MRVTVVSASSSEGYDWLNAPRLTRQADVSGWYDRRQLRDTCEMRSSRQYQRGFLTVASATKYTGTPRRSASSTDRLSVRLATKSSAAPPSWRLAAMDGSSTPWACAGGVTPASPRQHATASNADATTRRASRARRFQR